MTGLQLRGNASVLRYMQLAIFAVAYSLRSLACMNWWNCPQILIKRDMRMARACVAMPAWSVPGSQSVRRPCMRRKRTMQSCSVANMAWPMCRRPVTFGGGMAA